MSHLNLPELTRRQFLLFTALCSLVYFTSYMTRINYVAAISAIAESLELTNQMAGMAVIGSFITYGIGQPIFGVLGDRFKPRHMIFVGMLLTSICNIIVFWLSDIYLITIVWCLNGFCQAMLWPPLIRIMAQTLPSSRFKKANVSVVTSASLGTFVTYLLVPMSMTLSSWRLAFIISAIMGLTVSYIWFKGIKPFEGMTAIQAKSKARDISSAPTVTLLLASGLMPILIVIVLQGALRDGITTWMPTYINDTYHFGTSISILSTSVLPVFNIVVITGAAYAIRHVQNELLAVTLIWGIGSAATILLIQVFATHAVTSILLMAFVTGCMHVINLVLLSYLPRYYAQYGLVSTMSGIFNTCAYIGSGLSIYVFALLSDVYGWKMTMYSWGMIALLGLALSSVSIRAWGRFKREQSSDA